MSKQHRRPAIPFQTQRELWARAAGRCEFRGCNTLVYKDDLTQQCSNLAVISHIVAFSPDGPRGDPIRSKLLEKDINNLMLTCCDHGRIIDDKALEAEYPEELLLEFKHEHEQRIRMLTETKEDAQTHVVLLQVSIDTRAFEIDETAAFQAILPKYPAEEDATIIDLSGVTIPAVSDGFFPAMAASITRQTHDLLRPRSGRRRRKSLSVFALAPVPLLIHFGWLLGDIECVDLYQRHRDRQDWRWKQEEEAEEFYEVLKPDTTVDGCRQHIAVLLSISAPVGRDPVAAVLGTEALVYEIRADHPGPDFLRSRKRLELFGYEVRKLLGDIRAAHGHDRMVHVFAAVPAPIAIEFGRALKAFDPAFQIYEYHKAGRAYVPALIINPRQEVTG